jgi:hypothetical protein
MDRIGHVHFHTNVEATLKEQENSQQRQIATQTALSEG